LLKLQALMLQNFHTRLSLTNSPTPEGYRGRRLVARYRGATDDGSGPSATQTPVEVIPDCVLICANHVHYFTDGPPRGSAPDLTSAPRFPSFTWPRPRARFSVVERHQAQLEPPQLTLYPQTPCRRPIKQTSRN
jgi:hypothetical protein